MSALPPRTEDLVRKRILERAEAARSSAAAAVARAESIYSGHAAPRPHLSVQRVLLEATSLRFRVQQALIAATELECATRVQSLYEQALVLRAAIADVLDRQDRTMTRAARRQLLAEASAIEASARRALARARLVPGLIAV